MADQHIRLLVVEDNPGDAYLIRTMLEEARGVTFDLECVDRLAPALQFLQEQGVDVILLDLSLPDSQGLSTFRRVQAQVRRVPVVLLSGLDDEAVAVQAVQEGAQDYLVKGHVDSQSLVRAVRYAIERERAEEQLERYALELRTKNVQMEADLQMARELQLALLPQQYPVFPDTAAPVESALRFHHRYLPTGAVGGDFFDVLALSDTEAGVFICDVMGHGVRAALVTAMVLALVEQVKPNARDPGCFLATINHHLVTILGRMSLPMFLSAFYLIADTVSGEMRYASAAHPRPLHVRRDRREVAWLPMTGGGSGPPLGVRDQVVYPVSQSTFAVHDLIVLYTDGLSEAVGPAQDTFGEQRLLAAVREQMHLPPAQMLDTLLASIQQFAVHRAFDDDVCVLGMEVAHLQAKVRR